MRTVLILSSLLLGLSACTDKKVFLVSGSYTLDTVERGADDLLANESTLSLDLYLDVDAQQLVVMDASGSELTLDLSIWKRADWASGCPGNFSRSIMETASLGTDSLSLDLGGGVGAILQAPVILPECPTGDYLALRDAFGEGDLDSSTEGCTGADTCLALTLQ